MCMRVYVLVCVLVERNVGVIANCESCMVSDERMENAVAMVIPGKWDW